MWKEVLPSVNVPNLQVHVVHNTRQTTWKKYDKMSEVMAVSKIIRLLIIYCDTGGEEEKMQEGKLYRIVKHK